MRLRYGGNALGRDVRGTRGMIMFETRCLLGALFAGLLAGCGDLGSVDVKLMFPDEATQASTRRLLFVVREVPKTGSGCAALWSSDPTGLAETRSLIDYPNRNDVLAAPVRLAQYPALTFLVYAHPSRDIASSTPIAGGCEETKIDPNATTDVLLTLERPPPAR